jgi:hypothetical protein
VTASGSTSARTADIVFHIGSVFEAPDGKQLFYATPSGIWSSSSSGGDSKQIAANVDRFLAGSDSVASLQWAVAGHSLYYLRRSPVPSLWVLRLDTGEQFEYLRFVGLGPAYGGTNLTVSQDEKLICFVQTDGYRADLTLVENFR